MPNPHPQQRVRPRKTPKQARSRATVDAIVEAAARILEAQGGEGFSTNAVAERAGVSIGSLYQYFPTKDALIGALIVRETAQLVEEAEAALRQPAAAAGLSALIRACVAHQLRRPALARVLDFEEARLPEDVDVHSPDSSPIAVFGEALPAKSESPGRSPMPRQHKPVIVTAPKPPRSAAPAR